MNYSTHSNEELVSIIQTGDEAAYDQLFRNLAPITLHEAEMYRGKMDTYGTEDFLQEGNIVSWEIISRWNFKGGKFSTYFGAAIRNRLIRIWRDYNLKNLVCIGESEDCRGNITRILAESDYAKEYRIKKAEQNKRWYEKKKDSQPPKEKKPPMTKEERSRKVCAYQKEYYAAHPDKLAERCEKNRIAEKARRERKTARWAAFAEGIDILGKSLILLLPNSPALWYHSLRRGMVLVYFWLPNLSAKPLRSAGLRAII